MPTLRFRSGKGKLYYPGLQKLVPYLDVYLCVQVGKRRTDITHPDGFSERWALRSRRHPADRHARRIFDLIIVTGDSLFFHNKADQPLSGTGGLLFFEDVTRGKNFGELRDPAQTGFERSGRIVDVVAVQTVAHFQAKRIPGAETDGFQPLRAARFKKFVPDGLRGVALVFKIDLDPARSRIPCGADQDVIDPRELAPGKSI